MSAQLALLSTVHLDQKALDKPGERVFYDLLLSLHRVLLQLSSSFEPVNTAAHRLKEPAKNNNIGYESIIKELGNYLGFQQVS